MTRLRSHDWRHWSLLRHPRGGVHPRIARLDGLPDRLPLQVDVGKEKRAVQGRWIHHRPDPQPGHSGTSSPCHPTLSILEALVIQFRKKKKGVDFRVQKLEK